MDPSYDITLFISVVEKGSFSAAARVHDITPAALSKRISLLEARLKTQLITRSTRKLELTEVGQFYFSQIKRVAKDLQTIEHNVRHLSKIPRGSFSISCNAAFSEKRISPLLPAFINRYPEVHIRMLVGDRVQTADSDNADLIIRSASAPLSGYVSRRVFDNPWVLCATPAYLATRGTPSRPGDLREHNCLIAGPHGITEDQWLFQDQGAILPVDISGNFGGFGRSVYEVAKADIGIARLPAFLIEDDLRSGRLVQVLAEYMVPDARAIYLFHKDRNPVPLGLQMLVEYLLHSLTQPADTGLRTQR